MRTHCAQCPAQSQSLEGSVSLDECVCQPSHYRSIQTNTCHACRTATTCAAGWYQTGVNCTGLEQYDVSCKPCKTQCEKDEYISGVCDGGDLFDVTTCVACKTQCPGELAINQSAPDCVSGMSGWYRFDGRQFAIDSSSYGHTLEEYVGKGRSGVVPDFLNYQTGGASVTFLGNTESYIQKVQAMDIAALYAITVVAWVRLDSEHDGGPVWWMSTNVAAGGDMLSFSANSSGLSARAQTMSTQWGATTVAVHHHYATDLKLKTWHHVGLMIRRNSNSTIEDHWQWSVNGVKSSVLTLYPKLTLRTMTLSRIGSIPGPRDGTEMYFVGNMDDVRIFEREISDDALQMVYHRDAQCFGFSGHYINSVKTCTGLERFDQVECLACKVDCGAGNYIMSMESRCNGNTASDSLSCMPCKRCDPGYYRRGGCSGVEFQDNTVCIPCNITDPSQCNVAAGETIVTPCMGLTTLDTAVCKKCGTLKQKNSNSLRETICYEGFYIAGTNGNEACHSHSEDYVCKMCKGSTLCKVRT
jgi:hypothetical protein